MFSLHEIDPFRHLQAVDLMHSHKYIIVGLVEAVENHQEVTIIADRAIDIAADGADHRRLQAIQLKEMRLLTRDSLRS